MRSIVFALLTSAALTGCLYDYSCGTSSIEGEPHGEWCGAFGSYGYVYIDEEMVTVLFTIDDNLDGDIDLADLYLPTWSAHFHVQHLEAGTVLPADGLIATCSRYLSTGPDYVTVQAEVGTLEILGESSEALTGGHSWRMAWDIQCPSHEMYNAGTDVVELSWQGDGYDFELYGVPPDYPFDSDTGVSP